MTTAWGRAGQRLGPDEAARRRAAIVARRRADEDRVTRLARERWAAGLMVPWRITHALGEMHGPEVDQACGVEEPTVDHWELGIVYPTWSQVLALSALTGYSPGLLCYPSRDLLASDTSMRFHAPVDELRRADAALARRFTQDAIERTLRAEGVVQ